MVALDEKDERECEFLPFAPPTFPVSDIDSAASYLHEHGFCVFREVASESDIQNFTNLLRADFQESNPSIPESMSLEDFTEDHICTNDKGLAATYAHGRAAWAARLHPPVRRVFSHILGVDESQMISSFDCLALSIRGAKHGTNQWWGHVDHAKFADTEGNKLPCADITAYQSSLYMTDNTSDHSCSFVAVPGSHRHWDDLAERHRAKGGAGCGCPRCSSLHWLPAERSEWADRAVRLRIPRGGLLVWNSRLIHQSAAAAPEPDARKHRGFARIAFMVAYGRAADRVPHAEQRQLAMLLTGRCGNSWPQLAQARPDALDLTPPPPHRRLHVHLSGWPEDAEVEALLPAALQGKGLTVGGLRLLGMEDAGSISVGALRSLLPPSILAAVPPSPSAEEQRGARVAEGGGRC